MYDSQNPIFHSKNCTIYIGRKKQVFYALKTSNRSKRIKHEWEMYQNFGDFPTIIKAYNFWEETNHSSFIQLEYATGGSISKAVFIEQDEFWRILAHIGLALDHIHSHGYIHNDISPSNILQTIGNDCSIIYKLSDFGITMKSNTSIFCEGAGPYISPEALNPNVIHPITSASDIWSLGAVLYEIASRSDMPRDDEGYESIRNGTFSFSNLPDEFNIVRSMMNIDPNLRPTASDLLELPQVNSVLSQLYDETIPVRVGFDQKEVDFSAYYDNGDEDDRIRRRQSFDVI